MAKDSQTTNKISIEKIGQLMEILLPIPRWWVTSIVVVFLFSAFELKRTDAGLFVGSFRISGISIALISLIWLPVLLKLIGLTGIGLKTSGVEASTGGLLDVLKALDPGAQRETLPPVIAALEVAELEAGEVKQPEAQQLRQKLQDQLASLPTIPKDVEQARLELNNHAREYEQVRRDMRAGSARTIRMSSLVSRMMALAKQGQFTHEELTDRFENGKDGDRLVALVVARTIPDARNFEIVTKAIAKSKTPFEQYQALRAAQEMLRFLNVEQMRKLEELLIHERSGAPGTHIDKSDMSRWDLSAMILKEMARYR